MANLDFSNLVDVDTTQTPTSSQPQASTLDFSNLVDVDTTQPQASTLDFSNLVDVDTTQPTSIIKDEDDLDTSQKWLSNAATIYEAEEGNSWKGSQKGLSDWLKDRHSKLGFDMTNMGMTAYGMSDMSDKTRKAWIDSMGTYDQTDISLSQVGRGVFHALTDPVGVASIVAGVGVGGLVKLLGSRGAAIAGRTLFKDQLKKALLKKGLKKPSKEMIQKVGKEIIKSRGKEQFARVGGAGLAWGTTEDLLNQSVDISLDYDGEKYLDAIAEGKSTEQAREESRKSEIDEASVGLSALIGGVFGGLLGRGMSRFGSKKELKKLFDEQDYLDSKEVIAKVDSTESILKDITSDRDITNEANRVQRELNLNGTVNIDATGRREALNSEISTLKKEIKDIKKTDDWKKRTENSKNNWLKKQKKKIRDVVLNKKGQDEYLKDTFEASNIKLERVGKDKYIGEKFLESTELIPNDVIGNRTIGQKVIAKVKQYTYDSGAAGEEAKLARTRKDRARSVAERNVQTRFKKLQKAIEKSYDMKIAAVPKSTYSLMNKAFKGETNAIETLSTQAPEVLKNIQDMRANIQDLQQRLLDSGAIKKGSNLEATIQKSILGDNDSELYITRQFEVFDNPKFGKMLNETEAGQRVIVQAKNHLAIQNAVRDKDFAAVKRLKDMGEELTPEQQTIYDNYMGKDGVIDKTISEILLVNNEDDLFKVFNDRPKIYGKILTKREDIPSDIRKLMGEYDDPFTNYANTAVKLFQTMETYNYEKDIANLVRRGVIEGAQVNKDIGAEIRVPLQSSLPSVKGVDKPFETDINRPFMKGEEQELFGTSEVADYIAQGNEVNAFEFKPLQQYLMLQGHTRAAKTVWSPTSIARNFLGAGWMAAGAGYLSPKHLKQIPRVFKSLASRSDVELNAEMEKGIALGFLQSGTELGAFKGAMKDATSNQFWDFKSPMYKDANSLKEKAKRFNTTAVKFYQSMDDVWKQYAFMNEAGNYRKILEDQGIDPDKVIRSFMSGDGLEVKITALDEAAANAVNKHMQNYAGVPKFIKGMRMLPMADFLAFKSELVRTQKNIIKSAFNDIKEGNAMMKLGQKRTDGKLKGSSQRSLGYKRLGSIISAQAAAPALALASAQYFGLNDTLDGASSTIKEGIETFDAEYNKGSNFVYYGKPKKGKGKRVNISYLNPWAATQAPIAAAFAATRKGENVDNAVETAFQDAVINPIMDTFGPSMLWEAASSFMRNEDERGKPIFREGDTNKTKIMNGITTLLKPFEPGGVKAARDIYESYNLQGTKAQQEKDYFDKFGISAKGRKKYINDQWVGLSGVKPEEYDAKVGLGFKVTDLKKRMGDVDTIFREAYQQRSPITVDELTESYGQVLKTQFGLATQIFDYIDKAKSTGLNNVDIVKAITDGGLFMKRLDKKVLYNMVNKGVFVPPPPTFAEIAKWGVSTKKMTGQQPPIRQAQQELINIYKTYVGSTTGVR
jgi:flagellar biosynthesis chaperone FliJ